ncbi:hypothetical protein CALVIDRAFT_600289 [Calocera viscosa TUFC12733]|uniref:Uncharacterized protein n=1 Tax=Calocera viscosa (strain TUFC12733) TaxID=1330018 RepID=A0A167JYG5_CALVF|nr:hypothetical protein CALVIDRAFT_600289 [Calocera viscosa TUFC12733]
MTVLPDSKKGDMEPPAYDENPWQAGARQSGTSTGNAHGFPPAASGSSGPAATPAARNVSVAANKDVTCTDEMVNKDVNAMYNFLMSQTAIPPRVVCRIVGKHEETRVEEKLVEDTTYRNGNRAMRPGQQSGTPGTPAVPSGDQSDGPQSPAVSGPQSSSSAYNHGDRLSDDGETHVRRTQTKKQVIKTIEVTAFNFSIDLTQYLLPKPVLWTAPDEELVYRGGTVKERWIGHTAAERERNNIEGDQSLLKSTKSIKTWVEEYVDRPGPLKEFEWSKGVDGWNWPGIRDAIKGSVLRSGYSGNVTVTFDVSGRHVFIRRPGLWASMFSDTFGNLLLWFSLIKPYLLYYYKQGRWAVGGEVWSFRRGDAGMKEGEWFRLWETTIERAVDGRMTIKEVLKRPWSESPGAGLEGYGDI